MKKQLLIWDFDGVISDTEKLWLKNRQILMKELLGIDWDWRTVNHYLRGTGDQTKRDVLDSLGIITTDSFWETCIKADIETLLKDGIELTPFIEDIFKMPIRQCIATGGVRSKTSLKIRSVGIESYFSEDRIFTVDMVKKGKPEPDLFLLAASSMGASPEESIVIEDSIAGLTAAIKAGCHPIAFLGGDLAENKVHEQLVADLGVTDIYHDMRDVKKRIESLF